MRQVSEVWGDNGWQDGRPSRRNAGIGRIMTGFGVRLAQWAGSVAAVVFLAGSLMYALVLGGHVSSFGDAVMRIGNVAASAAGLSAQQVSIVGLKRAVPQDVLDVVGVWQGGSLVGFDAGEARRRLEAEDWIASASVLRQFPNRLHIEIVERVPFALWQIRGKFHVIDRDGETLGRFAVSDNMDLPIVVGEGAEKQALRLINDLEAWPDLKSQVRAAALVAERRWTLYLFNGIKVLLPEGRTADALREIDRLHRDHDLLNRDVVAVDLRLRDRTVVRLSEEVVKIRTAKIAELGGR